MSDTPRSDEDPQDAGPIGSVEDSDFWDDDDGWDDRSSRRSSGGGVPPTWIIGIVVVALVVIVALVVRGGGDDGDDQATGTGSGSGDKTSEPADGTTEQCATWPGIGGLGRPPVADEPGIHVWSDLQGWHVSRVPGAGIPGVIAVITNNDADNPPKAKDGATGGATASMDGATLNLVIPEGAEPAEASFEPGAYSTAVVIILKDNAGAQLPVEAFTVGGGDNPSVNPITATQVMQPCGT